MDTRSHTTLKSDHAGYSWLVHAIRMLGIVAIFSPAAGMAQEVPMQLAQASANTSPGELFLRPFKFVPPKTIPDAEQNGPKRPPQQQRIADLHAVGNYEKAGNEGLSLLSSEKADDGLQLIVANSLAWSGRTKEATATYQKIKDPALVNDANVGIANILRWQNQPEIAAPVYRQVLAQNPEHADARSGLDVAERDMAPRTTVTFGRSSDSSEAIRGEATVNHRWRDDSKFQIYEIEAGAVRDELPGVEGRQQDITVRYQDLALQLKPTLELNSPTNINQAIFGGVKFLLDDDRVQIDIGRVNWAKIAANANALLSGVSASHLGIDAKREFAIGNATASIDYYGISDHNTIWTSDMRLISSLRPFGNNVRPYLGIETRQADFLSANYWSPSDGYGSLYGGLTGEWQADEWSLYGSAQIGAPVYGDAGSSWMLSGGAKRWVTKDIALSSNVWGMRSIRSGTEYRAQSINVILEKVWR
jgi:tetratricopeptide (TPR) repeat protein